MIKINTINRVYFLVLLIIIGLLFIQIFFNIKIMLMPLMVGVPALCDFFVIVLAMKNKLPNSFLTKELDPSYGTNSKLHVKIEQIKTKKFINSKEGEKLIRLSYFYITAMLLFIFSPLFLYLFTGNIYAV